MNDWNSTLRRRALRKLGRLLGEPPPKRNKYTEEARFWESELVRLGGWFSSEIEVLYGTKAPTVGQRVVAPSGEHAAVLTWLELHQKPKYLADLALAPDHFSGRTVLDVGSGPMPSAECFEACDLYCLDPLLHEYLRIGFPIHCYRAGTRFVQGHAERMPLADDSVDAVLSVNAIDHVDDFEATAREIRRVLRPGGELRFHIHYHKPKVTEPQVLDDERVRNAFLWCGGFEKVAQSMQNSSREAGPGEAFALWANA